MKFRQILIQVGLVFLLWRIVLFVVGILSPNFIPVFAPSYPFHEIVRDFGPWWIVRWLGFDSMHYVLIAQYGYIGWGSVQAFFPLFPFLLKPFLWLLNPVYGGLLFVHLTSWIGLSLIWKYVAEVTHNKKIAWWTLAWILTWPTGHFLGIVYGESLFLLLVVLFFMCIRREKWKTATLLVALASGARVVGVLLLGVLFFQIWWNETQIHKRAFPWKMLLFSLLGCSGLVAYMIFLTHEFKDPLYFLHIQSAFNTGRQTNFVLFPQVLWRSFKILTTVKMQTLGWYVNLQDLYITTLIGFVLAWKSLGWWRQRYLTPAKQTISVGVLLWCWGSFFIPPLTGTLQSMSRYMFMLLPCFIWFAEIAHRHPKKTVLLLVLHAILMLINVVFFIQGKFVA